MKRSISVLLALVFASSASLCFGQQPDRRLLDLQHERDKLKRTTDPIDRAKSDIKISEALLSLAGDAARNGDMDAMGQRLAEYTSAIDDAHETLTNTGRDARKKPHG